MTKSAKWLTGLILVAICYWLWNYISSSHGDQKVSYQPARKDCFSGTAPIPWSACIYTESRGNNGSVAYLLHGRNLSEQIWNDDTFYTAMIQARWQEQSRKPPTIVTVSFGPAWLLTPKLKSPQSGLLEVFVNEIIPATEKRTGTPRRRLVFGESMGGTNTLIAALRSGATFQKAAALCPGVYSGSPFSEWSEIQSFLTRTGADLKDLFGIMNLVKTYVADESEWKEVSPLDLIEKANPQDAPELYLSCGLYDKLGNFEGTKALADRAKQRGFKINWHPQYGGHCAIDIDSLADFLAED